MTSLDEKAASGSVAPGTDSLHSGPPHDAADAAAGEPSAALDEAVKVLAAEHGQNAWTPEEARRLRWKIDLRLFTIVLLSFALQYYDKTMISQAAVFGLRSDLGLVGYDYTLSASLLYVGFLAGAYPCALLAQIFPVERVTGLLVFAWGACLILTVTCHNFAGLATQRVFLGLLEGGISPILMLVIGSWYTKCRCCVLCRFCVVSASFCLSIRTDKTAEQALRAGVRISTTPQAHRQT